MAAVRAALVQCLVALLEVKNTIVIVCACKTVHPGIFVFSLSFRINDTSLTLCYSLLDFQRPCVTGKKTGFFIDLLVSQTAAFNILCARFVLEQHLEFITKHWRVDLYSPCVSCKDAVCIIWP